MPKWNLTLNSSGQSQSRALENLEAPFGYNLQTTSPHFDAPKKKEMIENKLMQIATAPKMQIFMTFMIVYMFIGKTLSIYTIIAIGQSLMTSMTGILKVNKMFQVYEDKVRSLFKYKAIYVAINAVCLGIVCYKLSNMGLISLSPAAYLNLVPNYIATQVSAAI